jgi:hypothetical protein
MQLGRSCIRCVKNIRRREWIQIKFGISNIRQVLLEILISFRFYPLILRMVFRPTSSVPKTVHGRRILCESTGLISVFKFTTLYIFRDTRYETQELSRRGMSAIFYIVMYLWLRD